MSVPCRWEDRPQMFDPDAQPAGYLYILRWPRDYFDRWAAEVGRVKAVRGFYPKWPEMTGYGYGDTFYQKHGLIGDMFRQAMRSVASPSPIAQALAEPSALGGRR